MADSSGQPQDVDRLVTSLKGALQDLVPVDEVVIRDFEGREYRLPTALPARRQIQVFRALAQVIEAGSRALDGGGELSGGGILKLLVALVTDETVVEQLGRSFRVAFPKAAAEQDPLDLFPIEEIVASLVPLLVRLARRSGALLADASG